MAILGQWLGFESTNSATPPPHTRSPGGIVISGPRKRPSPSSESSTLRKTKSDELLRDFDVMRFLGRVDERLKEQRTLLSSAELDRLSTLHVQAAVDECALLTDIIEHFEMENDKLRHRLALASPSSAAADALKAQRNMLVF